MADVFTTCDNCHDYDVTDGDRFTCAWCGCFHPLGLPEVADQVLAEAIFRLGGFPALEHVKLKATHVHAQRRKT